MEKYKLDYEQSLYFLSLSNETRETRVTADVLSPSFLASCGFTVWHSRARTHSSLNLKKTTHCSHFQCNLPFIICFQGKIDMLRRVDLKDVLKSGVTTSSFHNRTLPRPATAVPGKNGRNTCYVNVGSLQPNDSWVSSKKNLLYSNSHLVRKRCRLWTQFLRTIPISALKHTLPIATPRLTPRYGQYITHAQNHITRAVATADSCFVLIRTHQHGIAPGERSHLRSSTPLFTA